MAEYSVYDLISLFASILLPPIGVLMKRGFSHGDFWLNIILTLLGWLPGLFHAFYIVHKYRDELNTEGENQPILGERPQTIKIHSPPSSQPQHQSQNHQSQYQSQPQYQQYQQQDHQSQDKYNTPPSTPPHQTNYEDTNVGPSNEAPPAYDDKKLKGEADSYYNE